MRSFCFRSLVPISALIIALCCTTWADSASMRINLDQTGVTVSPRLYGIFFEDINRCGDGGLYAEMLINRSFEDYNLPIGWTALNEGGSQAALLVAKDHPLNENNPSYLHLEISGTGGRAGVFNQGYKGTMIGGKTPPILPTTDQEKSDPKSKKVVDAMNRFDKLQKESKNGINLEQGKSYRVSLYARSAKSALAGPLTVSLESQNGTVLASHDLPSLADSWKKYEFSLSPSASDPDARFVISSKSSGAVDLDMVSLFPSETFHNRPNGLRKDLAEMLEALHPAFVRFPGGSFGEGVNLTHAFRWKQTIGDLAQRPGQWNIWGYRTTNGLGYHEYLQMCEDLKAEPLFVMNCGMAEKEFVDPDKIGPWVQEALDAIEYANGDASTTWGALRAQAGHPEPFDLQLFEIGNENGMSYSWGGGTPQEYTARYLPFYQKLKEVYPNILTIATAPIQKPPISAPMEVLDEHYYPQASWFEEHAFMYDSYDRKGPKIYVGEYATKPGAGTGNMDAALGEAAFMTGMERNSDLVIMSSYAPLFVNPDWRAWNPNAIVFDSSRVYGTPSYYNQLLFSNNRADVILSMELNATPVPDSKKTSLYAVAGKKNDSGDIIIKAVNITEKPQETTIDLQGTLPSSLSGEATVLAAEKPQDENSFSEPKKIYPKTQPLSGLGSHFTYTFAPYSITVLRLKTK